MAVALGTVLAIAIALTLGWLVGLPTYRSDILARSKPTLLDLGIAVAVGGITGYAKVETKISGSLELQCLRTSPSASTLICVIGLGLAQGNSHSVSGQALTLIFEVEEIRSCEPTP
ncbi:DUF389 domain-containing protein [Nostoc sp. JL33]|uniref:DUF389 domain-containing protein n=1 Tax=Nostoc sp. JL33 TaxID=2815396 RepID=UPI0025EF0AB3|nr:DUF389 domain-containing protein [Nostoc sp. JL33]